MLRLSMGRLLQPVVASISTTRNTPVRRRRLLLVALLTRDLILRLTSLRGAYARSCGWDKPNQYQPGATVFGERWPIAGGLGVGQLQWRPADKQGGRSGEAEQLAMVEFDYMMSNAVVRVLTLRSGHRSTIAVLNASIISGSQTPVVRPRKKYVTWGKMYS